MMQEIGIESSLIKKIRNGEKTIEGRLGKPKFLKFQPGDILSIREDVWKDGDIHNSIPNAMYVEITQVLYFESFKEMLEAVDYETVIPEASSIEDAVSAYSKFYTSDDEKEFGVVAMYITPLGSDKF